MNVVDAKVMMVILPAKHCPRLCLCDDSGRILQMHDWNKRWSSDIVSIMFS